MQVDSHGVLLLYAVDHGGEWCCVVVVWVQREASGWRNRAGRMWVGENQEAKGARYRGGNGAVVHNDGSGRGRDVVVLVMLQF